MNPPKVINHPGFIADLKVAHKGQGPMKLRPRNPNRKQFYPEKNRTRFSSFYGKMVTMKSSFQQDLPARFATHFAFYGNRTILNAIANVYKKGGINVFVT